MGATYKHNKTLIGHWFCIPLCHTCDEVITYGSRREFKKRFGLQSALWLEVAVDYCVEVPLMSGRTKTALSDQFSTIPEEIFKSIEDCGE
jgi:hypothetical protein